MIIDGLQYAAYLMARVLIALFPIMENPAQDSNVQAAQALGQNLAQVNNWLPVSTLLIIIGIVLTTESIIWSYRFGRFIVTFFRPQAGNVN